MVIRIGIAQVNSVLGDVEANLAIAERFLIDAHARGCSLLVFPELFLQGYKASSFWDTAVTSGDPVMDELQRLVTNNSLCVVMGTARRDKNFPHLVYNSAMLLVPEMFLGSYDKTHIGNYETYTEGLYFAPGETIPVFETNLGQIGIEICYDISYPEVARTLALAGATLHIVLSAGGAEFARTWDTFLVARSLENAFFTIYANAVGKQGNSEFIGRSRIVGPDGQTVCQGPEGKEALVIGAIDPEIVLQERYRRLLFRDRRPSAYVL